MNNHIVLKYKNIIINNINIINNNQNNTEHEDNKLNNNIPLIYDNNYFMLQTPVFNDYELFNYNSKHYIDLKLNMTKSNHIQFLTFIDSLELKLNQYNLINNIKPIKTQIITDIQNNKSVKVKLLNDTVYYDSDKIEIQMLTSSKISLLLKIDYCYNYYSLCAYQILQLN